MIVNSEPIAGDRPLVSVGIPTYNRPEGLRRTLECIRSQTYRNLEIIISDNCSATIEPQTIALEHQQADARIHYHRQNNNIGLEANFKFLLKQAQGEFFFWAADDDEWTPDFVSVCMEHIGAAGSAMTAMRTLVQPRGLLRWKPPCNLNLQRSAFENAVSFFNNLQPSLFYGIHRKSSLLRTLDERFYDYYDCFFILRQILTLGFQTAAPVCFYVGVGSETPVFKPARARAHATYEYWPFLRDSLGVTLGAPTLSVLQKARLAYLLIYVSANEFTHFEWSARPVQSRVVCALKWLCRCAQPLFRLPLPPAPSTMVLPNDPVEVCSMFIPHVRLRNRETLKADVADTQQQLRAKLDVVARLEKAWKVRRRSLTDEDTPARLLAPLPPDAPLEEFPHRLGLLLLQLEAMEARIQKLSLAKWRSRSKAN